MTTEDKLLSMLNPPDYVSKIKLYCNREIAQIKNSNGKIIEITPNEKTN